MESRVHGLRVWELTHAEALGVRKFIEENYPHAKNRYCGTLIGEKVYKKVDLCRFTGVVKAYSFETGKFKVVYDDIDQMLAKALVLEEKASELEKEAASLYAAGEAALARGDRREAIILMKQGGDLRAQEIDLLERREKLYVSIAKCQENEYLTAEEVKELLTEEPWTLVERINKVDASGCRAQTFAAMLKEMVEAKTEIRARLPRIFNKRTNRYWEEADFNEITPSLWAYLGDSEKEKWPRARMILGDVAAL
jgi:hypothetical protein